MSEQTTVRVVLEVIVGDRVKRVRVEVQGSTPDVAELAAERALLAGWRATRDGDAAA